MTEFIELLSQVIAELALAKASPLEMTSFCSHFLLLLHFALHRFALLGSPEARQRIVCLRCFTLRCFASLCPEEAVCEAREPGRGSPRNLARGWPSRNQAVPLVRPSYRAHSCVRTPLGRSSFEKNLSLLAAFLHWCQVEGTEFIELLSQVIAELSLAKASPFEMMKLLSHPSFLIHQMHTCQ